MRNWHGNLSPFGQWHTGGRAFTPAFFFASGEPGLWLDPSDAANLNWRYNLLTWTEGTVAQLDNASNVTNAATTIPGFLNSIQFGDNSATRWAYKTFTMTAGVAYTVSCYVQMDDGSAPVVGLASNLGDFSIVVDSNLVPSSSDVTVTLVSGSLYRVTGRVSSPTAGLRNNGVIKYNTQSAKGFRVTGYQLEVGSTATTYQRITDVNAETVALFPNATLFQDSAGYNLVTTAGQPVGLALDKSKNLALGTELITNGDFSAGSTGWTLTGGWSISGGTASNSGTVGAITQTVGTLTIGRFYKAEWDSTTTTSINAVFGGNFVSGGAQRIGRNVAYGFCTGSTTFALQGGGPYSGIDNISVRELPGNHATQATSGSRPLYALLPANGVRNLANGSADVGNATFWGTSSTVNGITYTRVASGLDADGLPYADYTVTGTATAQTDLGTYSTSQSRSAMVVGQTLNNSFRAQIIAGTAPPANCGVISRIVAENSSFVGVETFSSAVTAPLTETAVTISGTITNATTAFARGTALITTASGATVNYTVRIKALQFELGSTRTAYQFNYANTNIAQPPFAQVGALLFDGTDDFMQTPSVDFAGGGISGPNILTGTWLLTVDGGTATATESPPGTLNLTGDGANGANAYQTVTTQIGRTYRIDFTTGGSASTIQIGTFLGGNDLYPMTTMNVGVNCVYFTATTTSAFIWFRKAAAVLSTVSGITVREAIRPADKMTVFAGVRKLSDAATAMVAELSADLNSNNGTFYITAPLTNGGANINFASKGTVATGPTASGFSAPVTTVLTGTANISGDSAALRLNGTLAASSSSDQGTGNFGNYPIFIGRRGGLNLPFNGYLYSLIVRGAATPAEQITQAELWVAGNSGFLPPTITGVPTVGVS